MPVDRESVEDAKQSALRQLETRMRTRREVRDALRRRGFVSEVVERVLDDFERVGLLDDRRYALTYIENRMRTRPRGYALLRAELLRKGIAPGMAAQAVLDAKSERPETDVARELLARIAGRFAALSSQERFRRQAAFLKSRGFANETARIVLNAPGGDW